MRPLIPLSINECHYLTDHRDKFPLLHIPHRNVCLFVPLMLLIRFDNDCFRTYRQQPVSPVLVRVVYQMYRYYYNREETPSDDLDARHHNSNQVELVIVYPTLPDSR